MSKAKLAADNEEYERVLRDARTAEAEGRYGDAVKLAAFAWHYLDGMMRFAKRYEEREFHNVPCVEMALRLAPLLLDWRTLDGLAALLREKRAVERDTAADLAELLEQARRRMANAHRLWALLDESPGVMQARVDDLLGGTLPEWKRLIDAWVRMGLVERVSVDGRVSLYLTTNLRERWLSKCASCGSGLSGAKRLFLEPAPCPACGQTGVWVMLGRAPQPKGD